MRKNNIIILFFLVFFVTPALADSPAFYMKSVGAWAVFGMNKETTNNGKPKNERCVIQKTFTDESWVQLTKDLKNNAVSLTYFNTDWDFKNLKSFEGNAVIMFRSENTQAIGNGDFYYINEKSIIFPNLTVDFLEKFVIMDEIYILMKEGTESVKFSLKDSKAAMKLAVECADFYVIKNKRKL